MHKKNILTRFSTLPIEAIKTKCDKHYLSKDSDFEKLSHSVFVVLFKTQSVSVNFHLTNKFYINRIRMHVSISFVDCVCLGQFHYFYSVFVSYLADPANV